MKACKCDRCGKFYLPNYNYNVTFAVDKWKGSNWVHLDLCNDCQDELEEWVDKIQDGKQNEV